MLVSPALSWAGPVIALAPGCIGLFFSHLSTNSAEFQISAFEHHLYTYSQWETKNVVGSLVCLFDPCLLSVHGAFDVSKAVSRPLHIPDMNMQRCAIVKHMLVWSETESAEKSVTSGAFEKSESVSAHSTALKKRTARTNVTHGNRDHSANQYSPELRQSNDVTTVYWSPIQCCASQLEAPKVESTPRWART